MRLTRKEPGEIALLPTDAPACADPRERGFPGLLHTIRTTPGIDRDPGDLGARSRGRDDGMA